MPSLELKSIYYRYPKSKNMVLDDVSAIFQSGTITSIQGRSGAGKSTLLHIIAGLEAPTDGEIIWDNAPIQDLSAYRRKVVSTISQSYLLFSTRTAIENVCYPMSLTDMARSEMLEEAEKHLKSVGITKELFDRLPQKLSGGEQQRVAIARCLAAHSKIIAADEPTGNLDEENAAGIVKILQELAHKEDKIIIIVTHDPVVAKQADVKLKVQDGTLVEL